MRSHGRRVRVLCQWQGAMHPLWFLEESRISGEDGDQDLIHEKEI